MIEIPSWVNPSHSTPPSLPDHKSVLLPRWNAQSSLPFSLSTRPSTRSFAFALHRPAPTAHAPRVPSLTKNLNNRKAVTGAKLTSRTAGGGAGSAQRPKASANQDALPSEPPSFAPDPLFNLRDECSAATEAYVSKHHPDILDLVRDGSLIVLFPRSYRTGSDPLRSDGRETLLRDESHGWDWPEVLFLVGTSHVSARSAKAVARVIESVEPDNVVVELCRSRVGTMYPPEKDQGDQVTDLKVADSGVDLPKKGESTGTPSAKLLGISGGNIQEALFRTLKLGGQTALLFRFALSLLADKVTPATGTTEYGAEFLAARVSAEQVGAQLVLGDRPVEITLKRAWRALSFGERMRMLRVLTSAAQLSKGAVELTPSGASFLSADMDGLDALERDDVLSELFRQLGHYFPSLLAPLIYERDAFLAWSSVQSKAVRGSRCVVSVMGKGHLRGVVYSIRHKGYVLRFPLVSGQEIEDTRIQKFRILRRVLLELALLVGGFWIFDLIT